MARLSLPPPVLTVKCRIARRSVVMRRMRRYSRTSSGTTALSSAVNWIEDVFDSCDSTVIVFTCGMRLACLETRYVRSSEGESTGNLRVRRFFVLDLTADMTFVRCYDEEPPYAERLALYISEFADSDTVPTTSSFMFFFHYPYDRLCFVDEM